MGGMSIGKVARQTGVSTDTIRFYIKRRLLEEPNRSSKDYRLFSEEAITRVRFIRNAKSVGMTLGEISELLKLAANPEAECRDVTDAIKVKISEIDERMKALRQIRKALVTLSVSCDETPKALECTILRSLENMEK